jgi:hypothetical protein
MIDDPTRFQLSELSPAAARHVELMSNLAVFEVAD